MLKRENFIADMKIVLAYVLQLQVMPLSQYVVTIYVIILATLIV